jgi:hypothetical protein
METNAENVNGIENDNEIDMRLEQAAKKHYEAIKNQKEKECKEGNAGHIEGFSNTAPAAEAQIDNLIHPLFTS